MSLGRGDSSALRFFLARLSRFLLLLLSLRLRSLLMWLVSNMKIVGDSVYVYGVYV